MTVLESGEMAAIESREISADVGGSDEIFLDERPQVLTNSETWSFPYRVVLGALLGVAGTIHIALAPTHASEWRTYGVLFALAGLAQFLCGVGVVAVPSRGLLRLAAAVSAVTLGAWVYSKVAGWPFGPEKGVVESASIVDVTCAIAEGLSLLLAYELLAQPRFGSRVPRWLHVGLLALPVVMFAGTSALVTSSSAVNHTHAGGDGHSHGATDDLGFSSVMNGSGDHHHDTGASWVPLDEATQAKLEHQMDILRGFIAQYPTVEKAEAGGFRRQGPYSPGIGAHYRKQGDADISFNDALTDADLQQPMLIFDGTSPKSKLAGFMYLILKNDLNNPPEGFAGPNDKWHYHTNVCIVEKPNGEREAPFGDDSNTSKEDCDKYGGSIMPVTYWMVHVWPVFGYESVQGLFGGANQGLRCPDGTYYTTDGAEIGDVLSTCKSATT